MKRNLQLDFVRGFLLIIIVIDHFFSNQNIIRKFTDGFIGWVSAAEGFVFISGLTAGLVYTCKLSSGKTDSAFFSAFKRSRVLYKYHMALFLILLIILVTSDFHKDFWMKHYEILYKQSALSVLSFSALIYQPRYFDILPMYAIYLMFVPFVIQYFLKGNYLRVMALSILAYLAGTFNLLSPLFSFFQPVNEAYFNVFSWQLVFFSGLLAGFLMYKEKIEVVRNTTLLYVAVLIAGLLFFSKLLYLEPAKGFFDWWAHKGDLRPLRLLNAVCIIFIVSFSITKYKQFFTWRPICFLGKYSLEVYSVHILLIILFKPFRAQLNELHAIRVTDGLYFFPATTVLLFFIIIPGLYILPILKSKLARKINSKNEFARHSTKNRDIDG